MIYIFPSQFCTISSRNCSSKFLPQMVCLHCTQSFLVKVSAHVFVSKIPLLIRSPFCRILPNFVVPQDDNFLRKKVFCPLKQKSWCDLQVAGNKRMLPKTFWLIKKYAKCWKNRRKTKLVFLFFCDKI